MSFKYFSSVLNNGAGHHTFGNTTFSKKWNIAFTVSMHPRIKVQVVMVQRKIYFHPVYTKIKAH